MHRGHTYTHVRAAWKDERRERLEGRLGSRNREKFVGAWNHPSSKFSRPPVDMPVGAFLVSLSFPFAETESQRARGVSGFLRQLTDGARSIMHSRHADVAGKEKEKVGESTCHVECVSKLRLSGAMDFRKDCRLCSELRLLLRNNVESWNHANDPPVSFSILWIVGLFGTLIYIYIYILYIYIKSLCSMFLYICVFWLNWYKCILV